MRLRFFFDAGSGTCFWTADQEAHSAFGDYAVATEALALPSALCAWGEALLARFDASIDWADPAAASPWSQADHERFASDARAFLAEVVACRPDIEFVDCLRTAAAT